MVTILSNILILVVSSSTSSSLSSSSSSGSNSSGGGGDNSSSHGMFFLISTHLYIYNLCYFTTCSGYCLVSPSAFFFVAYLDLVHG